MMRALQPLVGCFVNTLALRGDLSGDPTFRELLSRTRQSTVEAFAHADLPFDVLVDRLHIERTASGAPLCQIAFVMDQAPPAVPVFEGAAIESGAAVDGDGEIRPDADDCSGSRRLDRHVGVQNRPLRGGDDRAAGRALPAGAGPDCRGAGPAPVGPRSAAARRASSPSCRLERHAAAVSSRSDGPRAVRRAGRSHAGGGGTRVRRRDLDVCGTSRRKPSASRRAQGERRDGAAMSSACVSTDRRTRSRRSLPSSTCAPPTCRWIRRGAPSAHASSSRTPARVSS